jgi:flagellar basal body-associated protein FliL
MSETHDTPKESGPHDSPAPGEPNAGNNPAASAKGAQLKTQAAAAARKQKANAGLLLRGLRSSDTKVRGMTVLFLLSLAGAVLLLAAAGARFYQGTKERREVERQRDASRSMSEFLTRQAEEKRRRVFTSNLGEFTFELGQGPSEDGAVNQAGVTGLAEVEVIIECDSAETCEYIDRGLASVRDQVTMAFTEVSRDELIQKDGKLRIRKAIVDRVNLALPRGKVVNAFFGRLVID